MNTTAVDNSDGTERIPASKVGGLWTAATDRQLILPQFDQCLGGIFIENIRSGVVAELEIHFFLAWIVLAVQIGIQHTIAKPVGAGKTILSSHGGGQLIDFHKSFDQLLAGIDFQNPVSAGPVLYRPAQFILCFLSTGSEQKDSQQKQPELSCCVHGLIPPQFPQGSHL